MPHAIVVHQSKAASKKRKVSLPRRFFLARKGIIQPRRFMQKKLRTQVKFVVPVLSVLDVVLPFAS